ncbi:MAG: amino acid ABC transporter substrate-binding protein [Acidimicrobiia bacterium]|nr:amino acid ABC transporter substrate-binding protein [Acidimicrobiia bacterium]
MSRFSRLLAILAVFALIVAACGDDSTDTTAADAGGGDTATTAASGGDGEPILFAASLPLTGDFAIPGSKHADGYRYCVEEINARGGLLGRDVELLVEDNRSDPEVAVSQVQRHIDVENADALLGTFSSLLTFPASTVANQADMVYPIPSGGALRIWERGYDNIFYFQQNAAELIGFSPVSMIDYYTEQGLIDPKPTTVAIVHADDFFADAIVKGLVGGEVAIPDSDVVVEVDGYLEPAGIEAVFVEQWPVPFTDWLTLANSMKNSGADMVFAATASPDEAISLVDALKTVDYNPQLIWMSQGAQSEFIETLGDAAEGVTIHASWHPLANWEGTVAGETFTNQDFIDGFTASFDRAPDEDEAIPFALCQGIEQAITGVGSTDNVAMAEWMHARTASDPIKTVLGDFVFDDRGLPLDRSLIMVQWQGGDLKFVYPVGEFEGTVDLNFPKPDF